MVPAVRPSVAVVVGFERAFWRHPDVGCLVIAQGCQLDPELFQMKPGDLLIKMLWQDIDFVFILARLGIGEQFNLGQCLVGERGRHDKAGMARRISEIDETPLRQQDDPVAFWKMHQVNLWLDVGPREILQLGNLDLFVEVADVADDGHVLHLLHVIDGDDILVASGSYKNIGVRDNI